MTKQNKHQQLLTAHRQTQAEIGNLVGWLTCELQRRSEEKTTWGTVGSLQHVRSNLIETLAFLSGMSQSEIKDSLEEM